MPELPEVETVVRDLRPLIVGRTIRSIRRGPKSLRQPWQARWEPLVTGTRIEAVRRRGKWIIIDLAEPKGRSSRKHRPSPSSGEGGKAPRLIVHLGMTGQFTAVDAAEPAPDHLHLVFDLGAGRELRFRDPRRFGSVTAHPDEAAVGAFFETVGLGPEPFGIDPAYFRQKILGTSRTLKAVLLDQGVVAGVGNIYADEACFHAGLNPQRRGTSLDPADADRLRGAIETVLTRAVERRGSTIRDYVGGSGLRGGFQHEFRVYGRTGAPCPACTTAIVCVRLSGRSSHFCPTCQAESPREARAPRRKSGMKVRGRGS